ncbi:MAG: 2'-5' RNA ligase family protein [Phycisphaerales bacterium]|nr:MAG: 2'-5' RNA ligase family protein [Phycisphaerales bacterium]
MARIAVDVVLLPCEAMTNSAIELNRKLHGQPDNGIVLNKDNCLPHVSLAMGCVDKERIGEIGRILRAVALRYRRQDLRAVGIGFHTDCEGRKLSLLQIEANETLQSLHEELMQKLAPYFSYDAAAEMVLSAQPVDSATLYWIRGYGSKSSFGGFSPHITIGYGQLNLVFWPREFTASKLALCHLGNHCTCRQVIVSAELAG